MINVDPQDVDPQHSSDKAIRVLVVDDQPFIRRGIALILEMEDDIDVVGQAGDGFEALEFTHKQQPHVVLMDLQMPRLSGIAATRRITAEYPTTRVVVLTTFDTEDLVFEAIRAGAHAYLLKDASEAEVLDTLRAVHRGEFRLTAPIARKAMALFQRLTFPATADSAAPAMTPLAAHKEAVSADVASVLTSREERILALLAQGLSNKTIAQTIFLAEGTVKNYVSRIMEKLHARTRTELAVKAMRRNA